MSTLDVTQLCSEFWAIEITDLWAYWQLDKPTDPKLHIVISQWFWNE